MSESNYSIDRDLRETKALAENLIPYVYQDELYGTVGGKFGSGSMPSLTIGGLLMRLHRLHGLEGIMSEAQLAQLAAIDALHENARREWAIHYNQKLATEASSRLKVIQRFLSDCAEDPRTCASNYQPEALRRTIIHALVTALQQASEPTRDLESSIRKVDSGLRGVTQPADFIWASALQPAYPQSEYWWLYVQPPRDADQKK